MKLFKTTLTAVVLAAAGMSLAQGMPGPHAGHGMHQPGDRIVKILNLDATRAAQVTAIMTEQRAQGKALWEANKGNTDRDARQAMHAQMKALHEATKARLATVLTPAELAQLKDTMMKHRHHGDGHKQS
jgi:Spy/CpxP family protein refolding chaperone